MNKIDQYDNQMKEMDQEIEGYKDRIERNKEEME